MPTAGRPSRATALIPPRTLNAHGGGTQSGASDAAPLFARMTFSRP